MIENYELLMKLEDIRREQVLCAEKIIEALRYAALSQRSSAFSIDEHFTKLVKGLPAQRQPPVRPRSSRQASQEER